MKIRKLLSAWILIVSIIFAVLSFLTFAFDFPFININFWTGITGLLILAGSYYFTSIFYYFKYKSWKFLYLILFGTILVITAYIFISLPDKINLWKQPLNLFKEPIGAVMKKTFILNQIIAILGVISASVSFAPYYGIGKRFGQRAAYLLVYGSIIFTILPLILIIYQIVQNGLAGLTWSFLTSDITYDGVGGGIGPAIVGTLGLIAVVTIIVLPLGVGTAIYLAEYSERGPIVRVIRTAVNILQGTPSIVHGLFGFTVFVPIFGPSLLTAGLTLAILTLPIVIRSAEEALIAVPDEIRDASLALGGTNWQTIKKVVLPPALPGIITGTVLGLGRAAGETAPILFTGAVFFGAGYPEGLFSKFHALPYHLWSLFGYMGYKPVDQNAWSTALVLIIIVLGINVIAIILREKFRQRF